MLCTVVPSVGTHHFTLYRDRQKDENCVTLTDGTNSNVAIRYGRISIDTSPVAP